MRRGGRATLAALALVAAAGCGGPKYTFGEVEGTVKIDGKPAAKVLVQFMPDPGRSTSGPTAEAETDEQGRYKLRCEMPSMNIRADGAVVGWHRVVLTDVGRIPAEQGKTGPPPRVAPRYSLATTELSYEVKPGKQTIDLEASAR
jgi:hypothetical protein